MISLNYFSLFVPWIRVLTILFPAKEKVLTEETKVLLLYEMQPLVMEKKFRIFYFKLLVFVEFFSRRKSLHFIKVFLLFEHKSSNSVFKTVEIFPPPHIGNA